MSRKISLHLNDEEEEYVQLLMDLYNTDMESRAIKMAAFETPMAFRAMMRR
jgi:hypothetical protein